jgi:hypothetical protein
VVRERGREGERERGRDGGGDGGRGGETAQGSRRITIDDGSLHYDLGAFKSLQVLVLVIRTTTYVLAGYSMLVARTS